MNNLQTALIKLYPNLAAITLVARDNAAKQASAELRECMRNVTRCNTARKLRYAISR